MARTILHNGLNRLGGLNQTTFPDRTPAPQPDLRPAPGLVSGRSTRPPRPVAGSQGVASDEQLFEQFRAAGDAGAFETLVRRYEEELFGFLTRYLGDARSAEDAFQATFLHVYRASSDFPTGRRFRPWLYSIAADRAHALEGRTG